MEVTIYGDAEYILKKLLERGEFPSADTAVNALIVRTYSDFTAARTNSSRLPDPPVAFDDSIQIPEIPRNPSQPVPVIEATGLRLPDYLDVE